MLRCSLALVLALWACAALAQEATTTRTVRVMLRDDASFAARIDPAHGLVFVEYFEPNEGPGHRSSEHYCGDALARGIGVVRRRVGRMVHGSHDTFACHAPSVSGAPLHLGALALEPARGESDTVCVVESLGEFGAELEMLFTHGTTLEAVVARASSYRSIPRERRFVTEQLMQARAQPCP